jgi:hypothetical protein
MELDDFKQKPLFAEAPKDAIDSSTIGGVREQVETDRKKARKKLILFAMYDIMLAVIYLSLHDQELRLYNLGMKLLVLGLLSCGLYLLFKARPLKDSLFGLPLNEFLGEAEKRLQYITPKDLLIITPLLVLLGTGGGLVFTSRLSQYTSNLSLLIIIWLVFFTALCAFGFYAGKKNWKKEQGPILDEVKRIKAML